MRRVDLRSVKTRAGCAGARGHEKADHARDFGLAHGVDLHHAVAAVRPLGVIRAERELGEHAHTMLVDDVREFFVFRDKRVVTKAHHAAEIAVMSVYAGEARDDGAHAPGRQFVIEGIGIGADAALGRGEVFPGGGRTRRFLALRLRASKG